MAEIVGADADAKDVISEVMNDVVSSLDIEGEYFGVGIIESFDVGCYGLNVAVFF